MSSSTKPSSSGSGSHKPKSFRQSSLESFSMSRFLSSEGESIQALMQDPNRGSAGHLRSSKGYMPVIVGGSNPTSIRDEARTCEQSRCVLGVGAGFYQ